MGAAHAARRRSPPGLDRTHARAPRGARRGAGRPERRPGGGGRADRRRDPRARGGVVERAAKGLARAGQGTGGGAAGGRARRRGHHERANRWRNARHAAGRLRGGALELRAERIKDLFRATFRGRPPVVRVEGGNVHLKTRGFGLFGWGGGVAKIVLTSAVPWAIDVRGGMSELKAILTELEVERIDVHGGASEVSFRLPAPRGPFRSGLSAARARCRPGARRRPPFRSSSRAARSGLRVDRRSVDAERASSASRPTVTSPPPIATASRSRAAQAKSPSRRTIAARQALCSSDCDRPRSRRSRSRRR